MSSLRLAVVLALLSFAAACGSSSSSPSTAPSPTPSPTPTPAPTPGGSSTSVSIPVGAASLGDRAFTPDQLNVAVGTTVTWTNTDAISHTSTSNATGWDSGILAPGGQFSFTFQSAGTFPYHCAIHPGMVGTVVVN
jgi:plastocyanin